MFVLGLLSLVSVALATGPCCSPEKWEGNAALTMTTYDMTSKEGHFIEGGMRMSYDVDKNIIVSRQSIKYDNTSVQQTVINDYNSGIMYFLRADGSCSANTFDGIGHFCIPDNATHNGRINFGFGENTVAADSFSAVFGKLTMYIAVTTNSCVPLTETFVGQSGGLDIMESLHFSGISLGIADATVFNIPAACSRAVVSPPLPGLGKKRSAFY